MKFSTSVLLLSTSVWTAATTATNDAARPNLRGLGNANGHDKPFVNKPGRAELTDRLIIRVIPEDEHKQNGKSDAEARQLHELAIEEVNSHVVVDSIPELDAYVVKADDEDVNISIGNIMRSIRSQGSIKGVLPNLLVYPTLLPNDTYFGWHHGDGILNSKAAWDISTGSLDVTIAIVDTGLQLNHPDLMGPSSSYVNNPKRKEGYNAVTKTWESQGGLVDHTDCVDINGNPGSCSKHGTAVAGSAAATGNNNVGVVGMGWNLSRRPIRVSNYPSGGATIIDIIHGALIAAQNGDKVINISYSGIADDIDLVKDLGTQVKAFGGLLVHAAGNSEEYLDWGDRDNDDVIVVGATIQDDSRDIGWSGYGPSVDVMAPGLNIPTTKFGSTYGASSGTSISAPLTAGLIAMIWSTNPNLTPDQVETVLKESCDNVPGMNGAEVDNNFGHGRINSFKALSHPITSSTKSPSEAPTTDEPSTSPMKAPSQSPTTMNPTTNPTKAPTYAPSTSPMKAPSQSPTTMNPTSSPTKAPPTTGSPTFGTIVKYMCVKNQPSDSNICASGEPVLGTQCATNPESNCGNGGKKCWLAECEDTSGNPPATPNPTPAPNPTGGSCLAAGEPCPGGTGNCCNDCGSHRNSSKRKCT